MIRRKKQDSEDLFQETMPEPTPSSTEETDAQRRRRREIEFHKDIKFRDLEYEDVPEPPEDPNVRAVREWAEKNLPEFKHAVRTVSVQRRPGLMWRISFRNNAGKEISASLACVLRPKHQFPDNLYLWTILLTQAPDKDTENYKILTGMVRKPVSLTSLGTKIRKVLADGKN